MSLVPPIKNETVKVKKFIDFDKTEKIFYNNLYIDDYKLVIKMPLVGGESVRKEIKIKRFDLAQHIYLLSYD
jgi:hypothetical protein